MRYLHVYFDVRACSVLIGLVIGSRGEGQQLSKGQQNFQIHFKDFKFGKLVEEPRIRSHDVCIF